MGIIKILTCSLLILILIAVIAIPVGLVVLGPESTPLVALKRELKQEDIGRIKQFIKKNDPRRLRNGQVKKIRIKQEELNLALGYTLISLGKGMGAVVDLNPESATIQGTIRLPKNPLGDFLNMEAEVSFNRGRMAINRLTLGSFPLPMVLVKPVMALGYDFFKFTPRAKSVTDLLDSIQSIDLLDNQIIVAFQWDRGIAKRFQNEARDLMLSESDKQRISFYSREIRTLSLSFKGSRVSLADVLQPLFATALKRSQKGEPPLPENSALLFSLTLYAMNWSPEILTGTPDSRAVPRAVRHTLTLLGRNDLSRHFLISATIAAGSNSGLSSIVGLFKEMEDSRGGSGFSFADLAADKAGIRLAELVVGQESQALIMQKVMAGIRNESEFMPGIDHLSEGIMELEFKKTYRDLSSREYALVEQEIEQRISNCSVYSKLKD